VILGPGAARVAWVGRAEASAFFGLQDDLRVVFATDVDLVMVAAVENRYLARDIERFRLLLCAAQRCCVHRSACAGGSHMLGRSRSPIGSLPDAANVQNT